MKKKILFFDIDGTLVDFDGTMPASAQKALRKASAAGHTLVICSGRSVPQIYPWLLSDFDFSGIIANAGSLVTWKEKILVHETFGKTVMQSLIPIFESMHMSYFLQTESGVIMEQSSLQGFASDVGDGDLSDDEIRKGLEHSCGSLLVEKSMEDMQKHEEAEAAVYRRCPLTPEEMDRKLSYLGLKVRPSSFKKNDSHAGEVTLKGLTKAAGMQAILHHIGKDRSDAVGFGDSANDIDMLDYAGISVCMGNGSDEAKAHADLIADDIRNDGLSRAMKDLNLI